MIDVLSFHAARPTEAFILSELAQKLNLSLGSAHRLLGALVAARFLSRHRSSVGMFTMTAPDTLVLV